MRGTFTIKGRKFRSASERRYVVVRLLEGRVAIYKRSDSLATARGHVARFVGEGMLTHIVDTTTGEEVS